MRVEVKMLTSGTNKRCRTEVIKQTPSPHPIVKSDLQTKMLEPDFNARKFYAKKKIRCFSALSRKPGCLTPLAHIPWGNISWGEVQQSQPAPVQVAKLPSQPPPSTKYGQSGCWTCESGQSLLQTELGYSVEEWGCEQVVSQSGMMGFSHLSSPSITTHHAGVLGGAKEERC